MRRKRKSLGAHLLTGLAHAMLLLGAVVMVMPMIWMLLTSFKPAPEIAVWPPVWVPQAPTLSNYSGVFETAPFGRFFANSVGMSLVATLSVVVTSLLAGAVFAKYRFPGRAALFGLIIATAIVPFESYMIPLYLQLNAIGWINTYQGIVLPTLFMSFGIFLMRQHVASAIPTDYLEAARIDGASNLAIFRRIVVPLSVPALASFAIFQFLWVWNDLLMALIFVSDPAKQPMTVRIPYLLSTYGQEYNLLAAAAFLLMALPLVVFFALQRYFVQGLLAGSVKT